MKPKKGPLSPKELESAENHWIKESQKSLEDLDIALHNAPCTPVWTHSDSNNGSEDKKKVLDSEGPRSSEVSEI